VAVLLAWPAIPGSFFFLKSPQFPAAPPSSKPPATWAESQRWASRRAAGRLQFHFGNQGSVSGC
jgi:hypothetical protein